MVIAKPEITQNIGKRVGATRQRPAFKIFSQAETVMGHGGDVQRADLAVDSAIAALVAIRSPQE
ncbi:MAG: hypothetical protein IJ991_09525, partial [Thermoguttaceae bacterium]|nr:hypothetical protein [Thermoguttaceae bacterium]